MAPSVETSNTFSQHPDSTGGAEVLTDMRRRSRGRLRSTVLFIWSLVTLCRKSSHKMTHCPCSGRLDRFASNHLNLLGAVAMNDSPETAIEFERVHYRINGGRALLSDVNFTVQRGEILMLLGPSGSGKTTSLKLINLLLTPTEGVVRVDGQSVRDWDVIRLRRHIGYAIQDVGLFPHYTVRQNVALIPKLEGWEQQKIDARVSEVLQLVGLPADEFGRRYPDQLSGGQRQRVGLARALAADPPILLMDEPFGALDPITRLELQKEFKQLQQRLNKTVVFVTHDVGEALTLGHRIALMDSGKLRGIFSPRDFLVSKDQFVQPYVDAFRAGLQISQL
jgi:osmoprotectant transport system ATP-binding protein